jgi:hypothetical protein
MKINRKFLRIFCTGLALVFLFTACFFDDGGPSAQIYFAVQDYLSSASGGASADDPVTLKVKIYIDRYRSYTNWKALFSAIEKQGKFVALDLSECNMEDKEFSMSSMPSSNSYRPDSRIISLIIPDEATSISGDAFHGWYNLPSITIPSRITSIGDRVFENMERLAGITVDANNANYSSQDGILYNKNKTEIIFVPRAISGTITIPSGVTSIDSYAFYLRTSLASITIPSSVTSIGSSAFSTCTSLQTINIQGHSSQESADAAWGSDWRYGCSAVINYLGG